MVARIHKPGCRGNRDNSYRSSGRHKFSYRIIKYILSVVIICPASLADENKPIASASSAATGNVTNQAIQFQNNGAPSRQSFSTGVNCNGPTMMFSPFYTGGETNHYTNQMYSRSSNYGAQISFMVPLDGAMVEICKQLGKRILEKERLDYELVRALRCAELMGEKGFMFRPGSPMAVVCSDVMPIASFHKKAVRGASAYDSKSVSGSDQR